ncbi:hypothetical protein EYF80_056707 [Liparis tanakae]|uniref:Uncharacterized protein n=1 Tax=Liparis tanakae TaxID=230148 RepID=A0A4Z2EVZ5_9TELE|nr:hypothetical protein EYF80_056707 [Liparis tanakae]
MAANKRATMSLMKVWGTCDEGLDTTPLSPAERRTLQALQRVTGGLRDRSHGYREPLRCLAQGHVDEGGDRTANPRPTGR